MSSSPIQKILFGSPGTGKSFQIKNEIAKSTLGIDISSPNYIATVFHPEYTYGDFMGKLLPLTNDNGKVEYSFYCGHFLKALAQSYKNIIQNKIQRTDKENQRETDKETAKNVILVIDEINRGNSAAIFGTVFQLLDRQPDGWSSYSITISHLEFKGLLKEMSFEIEHDYNGNGSIKKTNYKFDEAIINENQYKQYLAYLQENSSPTAHLIQNHKIKIPYNLSIVGSMNTSDNSIYLMDSAFKRRWEWEFVNIEDSKNVAKVKDLEVESEKEKWTDFVDKLNAFFIENHKVIRKIEDKQIGYFFINTTVNITKKQIKNKLMFFIWDSVFTTDKKPLIQLLEIDDASKLVTFGHFTQDENVEKFIRNIIKRKNNV